MKSIKYIFFALLVSVVLLTVRCVEPFEPEITEYDSAIVVDGLFSNSDSPSRVTLSNSFAYSEESGTMILNANVQIEDDEGGSTVLQEVREGIYETNPTMFKGEVGKSYRLIIITAEGAKFESEWELMKESPAITEMHVGLEDVDQIENSSASNIGLPVYLNTKDATGLTKYYSWEVEETYEYPLRFGPKIRVDFGKFPGFGEDEIFVIGPDEFEGHRCWKTERSKNIIIASTDKYVEDALVDFPIYVIDLNTSRLDIRYSILAKQYALNSKYYEYLRQLEESNESTGSLFDPIPNELLGNVKSSDNASIPVFGYFSVAGVSEHRIFFDREELPIDHRPPIISSCPLDTIELDFKTLDNHIDFTNDVLYDYLYTPLGTVTDYLVAPADCAYCRANDATNIRPDFW